ncbi:MAG: hypothetical protein QOH90_403 [Actinomycetota bacterium]|nr:hypothetical protein [Actinomycetota bacterium]
MCDTCGTPSDPVSRRRFLGSLPGGAAAAIATLAALRGSRRFEEPGWTTTSTRALQLICKEAWRAGPPHGSFRRHHISRITIHHSGVKLTDNRDAPGRFRAYQQEHQDLGWPDIAYHLLIDRHGNVYKGRHMWAVGDTRTSYDPTGHLLVMCEGNMSEQDVSIRQMRGLVEVLTWATRHFDVPLRRIRGHRDFAATDCPGANLYRRIEDGTIRHHVTRRRREGGVSKRRLCGDAGSTRVRKIESGTD